jgi:hypothetical protein
VGRRLLNLLTALSALLCAVFVAARLYAWWQLREMIASFGGRLGGPGVVVHVHESYIESGIPLWLLIAVTAVLPLRWAVRFLARWRAKRQRPGICRRCGYDLRATPERCPECGAAPVAVR